MQMKKESLALEVLKDIQTSRTIDFSTIKELLGSDDKAGRALRYLLDHRKIVELYHKQWNDYGIREHDKRKKYYVLAEDNFANKEWDKVKNTTEMAVSAVDTEHGNELVCAILSVLPHPGDEVHVPRMSESDLTESETDEEIRKAKVGMERRKRDEVHVPRMSRFRNKEDIQLLIQLYKKLVEWNIDQNYMGRWAILGFIYGCVISGTLMIGDTDKKELSEKFRNFAHDALAEMLHANDNALNIASPMAIAFEAFRIYVALDQSGIIKWIGDELNNMLGLMDTSDAGEPYKAFIFQQMIDHYRSAYPQAFRMESVNELSLTLLEMILDGKTRPEMRHVLQAIRRSLIQ